jgi:hypothetical protein
LQLALGQFDEAEASYLDLIHHNTECHAYFHGLKDVRVQRKGKDVTPEQVTRLTLEMYSELKGWLIVDIAEYFSWTKWFVSLVDF